MCTCNLRDVVTVSSTGYRNGICCPELQKQLAFCNVFAKRSDNMYQIIRKINCATKSNYYLYNKCEFKKREHLLFKQTVGC